MNTRPTKYEPCGKVPEEHSEWPKGPDGADDMARLPRIYLETTMFNYYFDKDREAHPDTVKLFEEIAAGKYEAYTSKYVIGELEETRGDKRNKMLDLIPKYGISILEEKDEASRLASIYIAEGVIPKDYRTDCLHIAVAAVNGLDMILSLNFKHIVSRRTEELTGAINKMNGYKSVKIRPPTEVVEYE